MKKIIGMLMICSGLLIQAEASDMVTQARDNLMNDAYAHLGARVLHYAADVKIADCIDAQGSTLTEVHQQLQKHIPVIEKDRLERILHVLQNHNIISYEEDKYLLTEKGYYLRSDHPESIRAAIAKEYDSERWAALGHLHLSVNGGNAFKETHQGCSFYDYLQQNPQANTRFNQGMSNYSELEHRLIPTAYSFAQFNAIVDIGGGKGELLQHLHKLYPQKQLTLIELDSVVQGLSSVTFQAVAGNFFEPIQEVTGNAAILKRVLHNWSDEDAVKILQNVSSVIGQQGKLVIIEKTQTTAFKGRNLDDADIIMLTLGGNAQSRTSGHIEKLLQQAGYKLEQVFPVEGCDLQIFEATKKPQIIN